ncbi:MAG: glycosyltransferase family 39 protein [Ardenticatenia bacterium]|nr:glycosyltransferase family 39 protein [Ardenticatenia bacterium]
MKIKSLPLVLKRYVFDIPILPVLLAFYLLSINLATAPPLWWDEGWTLMVARNVAEGRHYGRLWNGMPVSPNMAAAPTVVLPAAASFRLFGVGGWQGRLPALFYTVIALCLLFRVTATLYSQRTAVLVLWLTMLTPTVPDLHPLVMGKQVLAEVPALVFLLAGYIGIFHVENQRRHSTLITVGLLWGMALISKQQAVPFLILSTLIVCAFLSYHRKYRRVIIYGFPVLIAAGIFLAWRWIVSSLLTPPNDPISGTRGLIWVTALIFSPNARGATLVSTLLFAIPIPITLAYTARHHLDSSAVGIRRLALWTLTAGWFGWFIALSAGAGRYLFPVSFINLIFLGSLIDEVAGNISSIRSLWTHYRLRFFFRLKPVQRMAAYLLLLSVPLSVISLVTTLARPDRSPLQMAAYVQNSLPRDSLIETYDAEIMFQIPQKYHYPPDQIHVDLIRLTFLDDSSVEIEYDPLSTDPDYLINGPFPKMWGLYPTSWLNTHFRLEISFGPYDLWRRKTVDPPSPISLP